MQTAHSEEWRPGFAKRAENFSVVCANAQSWRWAAGETVARVAAAVLKGTPQLSIPQRMTLLLYVEHLNQERLEQDVACVWPSTSLIADYLGCSESQARTNWRALEAAGYLVRDYNRANRPAGIEAYDLRPLMGRLDELEQVDGANREAMAVRRAAYSEALIFPTQHVARAPGYRRLEQSNKNTQFSVRESDAAPPRNHGNSGAAPQKTATTERATSSDRPRKKQERGSSTRNGVSGGASPDPSVYAEMVRQELRTAVEVCPRLAPLVRSVVLQTPASATSEDAARIAAAAAELLPEPDRNNDKTVIWGWHRHGIRVVTMLAIALEDPEVRSPCSYFGKLAVQERGATDLRLNLARILRQKNGVPSAPVEEEVRPAVEPPPLMFAPGSEDAPWPEISSALRRLVREGAYGSWFNRVGFHGVEDGVLTLSTPTGIAADRIKADYLPAILMAAEEAGVFVERVILTVRKR